MDHVISEFVDRAVRLQRSQALASGQRLEHFYGTALKERCWTLQPYTGIVDYEPTESY
jgi:hypothetical protein